jgi:hypothetical protein
MLANDVVPVVNKCRSATRLGRIYSLRSITEGKVYIGQTLETPKARWTNHCADAKLFTGAPLLGDAIRRFSPRDFVGTVEKECVENVLDFWEKWYIVEFNTRSPNGYNVSAGGGGGGKTGGQKMPTGAFRPDPVQYVLYTTENNNNGTDLEGWTVANPRAVHIKRFSKSCYSIEDNHARAIQYNTWLNNLPPGPKYDDHVAKPKHMSVHKITGYKVKLPFWDCGAKHFTKGTREENYIAAYQYLEALCKTFHNTTNDQGVPRLTNEEIVEIFKGLPKPY